MPAESRYILHASAIDACLQLILISINAGQHKELDCDAVAHSDGRRQSLVSKHQSGFQR